MNLLPLLVIAAAFWGQSPACGYPDIEAVDLPPPIVGLADSEACSISIRRDVLSTPGLGCEVALHEYGHLLGLGHSTNPNNVMYPVMRLRPVWPCAW